ncbi:hypothetical protein [Desulfobotulus alkaliphilus]|uniref:hypothetical protein n=1 Tax=Desulfobotulus alkaliphilus TaxID=622671 RepID=UPI001C97D3A6|nr:hypothetical protein [Desulfobotulus alkaliphilus]
MSITHPFFYQATPLTGFSFLAVIVQHTLPGHLPAMQMHRDPDCSPVTQSKTIATAPANCQSALAQQQNCNYSIGITKQTTPILYFKPGER